ncbi:MAG: hypothetical protein U0M40_07545, partial [Christensenellales bacterium]
RVLEAKEYGRTRRTSAEILVVFQMRTTQLCRAVWLLKPCVSLSTDGNIYGVYYVDNYQKGSGKEVDPAYGKPSLIFISDLSLMGTCYHLPAFMSSIFYKII